MLQSIKNSTNVPIPQPEQVNFKKMVFMSKSNSLEKSPEKDEFDSQKKKTKKYLTIGLASAIAIAALIEGAKFKWEHLKKLIEKIKGKKGDKPSGGGKPDGKPPKPTAGGGKPEGKPTNPTGGGKPATPIKPDVPAAEIKKPVLKDQSFEFSGNKFEYKNGELVSYKNAKGDELIEKYKNPQTDGDKNFKEMIDAEIERLAKEQEAKAPKIEVKPEAKPEAKEPVAEGNKPEVKPEAKEPVAEGNKPEAKEPVAEGNKPEAKPEAKEPVAEGNKTEVKPEAKEPVVEGKKTEVKTEVKKPVLKDQSFEFSGNKFEYKNGELVSYKNANGDELIEKYRNPQTAGDKEFKAMIDTEIERLAKEQASKVADKQPVNSSTTKKGGTKKGSGKKKA